MSDTNYNSIEEAFEKDGYNVVKREVLESGARGYMARSKSVKNSVTGEYKNVFYVEGSGYDMGYLIGLMAPDEAIAMTKKFPAGLVLSFLSFIPESGLEKFIVQILVDFYEKILEESGVDKHIPEALIDEMKGVMDGLPPAAPGKKSVLGKCWC